MTTPNYTPGPWHVGEHRNIIIYDSQGNAISNANTFHGKHQQGQADANARLIAAAPELLEALKDILHNMDNCPMSAEQEKAFRNNPVCESWRVYLSSLIIQARNQARHAIAKAEGRGE